MTELKLWQDDPWLEPFKRDIWVRHEAAAIRMAELSGMHKKLSDSANGHLWYGVHLEGDERVFREWAPNATAIHLLCEANGWKRDEAYSFSSAGSGNWELRLPVSSMKHGDLYKWLVSWNGGEGERIPAYARRVVQDNATKIFYGANLGAS